MSIVGRSAKPGWRGLVVALGLVTSAAVFSSLAYASITGHDLDNDHDGDGHVAPAKVSLRVNAAATTVCHISDLVPGDSPAPAPCRFSVSYTGTVPAYVALNVVVRSAIGRTGHSLYDAGRPDGITFEISDGHHLFDTLSGPAQNGGACPPRLTCWSVQNDLAAWYRPAGADLVFTRDTPAISWTETPVIPAGLGNEFQGATATLVLTAEAVEATTNALPPTCTILTIGRPCAPTTHFAWN